MQYNKTLVKLAKTFLANENVEVYFDEARTEFSISVDVHNNRIWTDGDGLWSTVAKGVKVQHANFLVSYDDEDNTWSGGLAGSIHYDGSGEDGTWYDGADVENNTLINKIKDMRESDGMIYGNDAFINNLQTYMVDSCDFDLQLCEYLDFDYSEQGMQDDECVNLDVECDGTFWLYVIDEMKKEGITHRQIGEEDLIVEEVA